MLKKKNLYGEGWLGIRGNTVNPVCSVVNNSDPHFLRVPCWKITLFVIVPVLGPLVALIICYNWLHRRLAGAVVGQQTGPPISGLPSQSWMGNKKMNQGSWFREPGFPSTSVPRGQTQAPQRSHEKNHLLGFEGHLSEKRGGGSLWICTGKMWGGS